MTDRELLERAAKAAGINLLWTPVDGYPPLLASSLINTMPIWWNPLTDDGDLFRLAVKLGIDFYARVGIGCTASYHEISVREFAEDGDLYAATRRAVVRAAAAMVKE